MPRMRSIKPEITTSEQFVQCSHSARLMFITLWTQCDDAGVHPDNLRRLKMALFPGDDQATTDAVSGWLDELITFGLVGRFESNGEKYICVTGWQKHQKPSRPFYRYPRPPQWHGKHCLSIDQSVNEQCPNFPQSKAIQSEAKQSQPNQTMDPASGRSGALARLEKEDLGNTALVIDWAKQRFQQPEPSDAWILFVLSAAECALDGRKNAGGFFVSTVEKQRHESITIAQEDRARQRLKEFLARPPTAAAMELAGTLKRTESDDENTTDPQGNPGLAAPQRC